MPLLLPVLAVLIWAANTVVNKLAAGAIMPAEIGFYRWLLAALLFTPVMLRPLLQHRAAVRAQAGRIVVLGLLGMVVYQSLAYYAAHSTSATNMGIILSLMPMMALALAIALLGQQLTLGAITGSVVSFAGVLIVVSGGSSAALLHHGVGSGDALMLIATLAYALYSVLLKKWQIQLPSLLLLYLQVLVAVVLLFPLYLASPKTGLSAVNIPLVLYAGLFASMLAPLLWMTGVAKAGPSRTTLLFNLSPVFTALIAATPILHERLAWYHLVGGVLTLAGVLLSERWKQPFGLSRRPA
ncbi:DMT family transporter [Jeongeupia naejangsanensis]|uniref:DMT family transporter n=1 Tax=Jeongeupia naejangsanensis TaxID=613195 RepID=A0ABS2BPC2_9NEIS|nr:DMT family transporter [Jeongeupia naejangsanensis]MBM3117477.1 DMT family transporter [Jeongeupia naejangsanensis]